MSNSCSTPALHDGLVFALDYGRNVHCLDAQTGESYWVQETRAPNLSSPLVADGKLYVGTKGRKLWVFAADRRRKGSKHSVRTKECQELAGARFRDRPLGSF